MHRRSRAVRWRRRRTSGAGLGYGLFWQSVSRRSQADESVGFQQGRTGRKQRHGRGYTGPTGSHSTVNAPQHRFGLLLGSNAGTDAALTNACDALAQSGRILARSAVVRMPSLTPGDHSLYFNQAVLFLACLPRARLIFHLKAIEQSLGRDRSSPQCLIDIDLLSEYDAEGRSIWLAPRKLAHPAFHHLLEQVRRAAFGSDPQALR